MLPKHLRITRDEFNELGPLILKKSEPYLALKIFEFPSPVSKYAVIVSKKISKLAHERNSMRRRVYSILRNLTALLPSNKAFVFQVKQDLDSLSAEGLEKEIEVLLEIKPRDR